MKTKLIIILLTFVGTTLFWCAVIFCSFFFFGQKNEVGFVTEAHQLGYWAIMTARNNESRPVTFTVTELPTNTITKGVEEVVLLERELQPAGAFWVGIKKRDINK